MSYYALEYQTSPKKKWNDKGTDFRDAVYPIAVEHCAEAAYYKTSDGDEDIHSNADLIVYVVGSIDMGYIDYSFFTSKILNVLQRPVDIRYIGHTLTRNEKKEMGRIAIYDYLNQHSK